MGSTAPARAAFFKTVYGPVANGHACIAYITPGTRGLREKFFRWPQQADDLLQYVEDIQDNHDVYYCPQLLNDVDFRREEDGKGPRVKENVGICTNIWADLDTCHPDKLLVQPTIIVESSPDRYQALWVLDTPLAPDAAEDIARRIAYHHLPDGADKSGWDLTQLLRVPLTRNMKYVEAPHIKVRVRDAKFRPNDFRPYPEASKRTGAGIPMPEQGHLPDIDDPVGFLQGRRKQINSDVFRLFSDTPTEASWSEPLWKLLMLLFEGGLDREQVFVLARQAACNKYARDGRPEKHLWDDVCRAYIKHMEDVKAVVVPELEQVDLLTDEELEQVQSHYTFVERYVAWATGLGDAAPQYHQAGAFIILSAIMSGRVSLPTSFGTIIPNLWFMLLADTTLTRKSTAMDIATDLLIEIDPDVIMATDGSIEGLLQGLSTRPGRPSIFLRDEFSGLLESMTKKDYLAGMAEMLTKLYDGKFQKRLLRKDPVEIRDPVLILFTGGIRNRVQQLLTLDHVSSGFVPRFVYLTAESDISRVRPLGPPVVRDTRAKEELLNEIRQMHAHYTQTVQVSVQGTGVHIAPPRKWSAKLSPEAWARFNKFEAALNDAGVKSDRPDLLTPVYARLGVSALKAATLMAASSSHEDEIVVEEIDILHAVSFAAKWREYAIDVINGVGKTQSERDIERVYNSIERNPGISRSALMQSYHMTARGADSIFQTLEQRGLVTSTKYGKGTTYRAIRSEPE